jgi:hypothetical protein
MIANLQFQNKQTLKSVYGPEQWTTCKQREKLELRAVDYILYKSLNLIVVQNLPNKKTIVVKGLPDKLMPSDHLSLFAIFSFAVK